MRRRPGGGDHIDVPTVLVDYVYVRVNDRRRTCLTYEVLHRPAADHA
jgi:hypothetical protein